MRAGAARRAPCRSQQEGHGELCPIFLDGQGFVPFATMARGMDVAKKLNGEYKGSVNQGSVNRGSVNRGKGAYYGGEYFSKMFPRLSIIRDAKVV